MDTTLIIILGIVAAVGIGITVYFLTRKKKPEQLLSADEYQLLVVDKKFGNYTLVSWLSRGTYATTFEAIESETERKIALKILHKNLIYNRDAGEQLHQKGDILRFLGEHNSAVGSLAPIDYGTVTILGEPRPYLATGYVDGATLSEIILTQGGKIHPRDASLIIKQLADIAEQAHSHRLWIRDFSPNNIIITVENNRLVARLTDIGIPYKDLPFSEETREAKRAFYAPEEYSTQGGVRPSPQTDVYALCALYLYMTTGSPYLSENSNEIFTKAMAQIPEQRYESIIVFVEKLLQATDHIVPPTQEESINWKQTIQHIIDVRKDVDYITDKAEQPTTSNNSSVGSEASKAVGNAATTAVKSRLPRFQLNPSVFIGFFVAVFLMFFQWLITKIVNAFNTPKKVIKKGFAALVLLAVGIWYFIFFPTEGTLVINVKDRSDRTGIGAMIVNIVAIDKDGNRKTELKFSSPKVDNGDDKESEIEVETANEGSAKGAVVVKYFYRWFKPENINFRISLKPQKTYFPFDSIYSIGNVRLVEKHIDFTLRPTVEGDIPFSFASARKTYGLTEDQDEPKSIIMHVAATDSATGTPRVGKFTWAEKLELNKAKPIQQLSIGNYVWQDIGFNRHYILHYTVEDSTMITVRFETDKNDKFKLGKKSIIAGKGGSGVTDDVKIEQPEGQIQCNIPATSYRFIVKNCPRSGVEIYIDGVKIGSTDGNGVYPMTRVIENPCKYWETVKKLKLRDENRKEEYQYSNEIKLQQPPAKSDEIKITIDRNFKIH